MVPAGPAGISWNRGAAAPRFPAAFAYAGGRVSVSPHVHGGPVAVTCNVHLSTCTQSASTGWLGGRQWAWRPSGHFGADCEVKAVQGSCRGRDGLGAGVPSGPWGRVLAHGAHRLHSDTCLVWLSLSGRARCSPGQANRATMKRYGRECPQGPKGGAQRPDSGPARPPRPLPRPALPRGL